MTRSKRSIKIKIPPALSIPDDAHLIYSDGSYRPDGNASYAYLIFSQKTKHIVDMQACACRGATINQMEMQAINHALDHPNLKKVIIFTDSMYTLSSLTLWRHTWAKNNWLTPNGEPVKNQPLIREIASKMDALPSCKFVKVSAHTGDYFNSVVDYLATRVSYKMREDPCFPDGPICL